MQDSVPKEKQMYPVRKKRVERDFSMVNRLPMQGLL